jgi:ADP-L-glycero-D-manno-heptose 6-epimerase
LARLVHRLVGHGRLDTIPFPADLVGKYQTYTQADLTALRRAGYAQPFLELEEGLARYASVIASSGGYYRP